MKKKNLNKEIENEENRLNEGVVGLGGRITNRLPKWAIYLLVLIMIAILFIILYFTNLI